MTPRDHDFDPLLDRALEDIRGETPPDGEARQERVLARLLEAERQSAEDTRVHDCGSFRALIPDHVAGRLEGPRKVLLADHLSECVGCRRVYRERKNAPRRSAAGARPSRSRIGTWTWRLAAAAAVFVALFGVSFQSELLSFETGGVIHVDEVQGELFQVTQAGVVPLAPGSRVDFDDIDGIRTAKGSQAMLTLPDESRIELRERSELALRESRSLIPGRKADGVIDLARGSVIVEASDQGSGHLFVRTDACKVAVTGTVFSVNHGVKGSRVSVIEGEVHVAHAGSTDVLTPGEQATTHPSLGHVPVEEEIAWSAQHDRWVELLGEFRALSKEIDEVLRPGLRYGTELLDVVPADTAIYFGIPNLSDEVEQAYGVLTRHVAESPALEAWWNDHLSAEAQDHIRTAIERIGAYGDHLGEEIVMTFPVRDIDANEEPLFLAHLTNPAGFAELFRQEMDALAEDRPNLALIEGPLPASAPVDADGRRADMLFWVTPQGLVAMTPGLVGLEALDAVLAERAPSLGSSFHDELSRSYADGVEWLVGFDLARLMRPQDEEDRQTLSTLGILDARHLIATRRPEGERSENRVVVDFDQPRRRMAAWLAEPASIGALEYVSPTAGLASGFAMKDMGVVVDELFEFLSAADRNFESHLAEFEREAGFDVRRDFAASLGGEFAMAIDGPLLPQPSTFAVVEVYDAARLQATIESLVERIDRAADEAGYQGLALEEEAAGGSTYYRLTSLDSGVALNYAFDGGYAIFGTTRAVLQRAIRNRAAGVHLVGSPQFLDLLPRDGQVDFSGVVYHNLGPVLGPLSSGAAGLTSALPPAQQQLLASFVEESKPTLAVIYGERERIVVSSSSDGGLLSSSLRSLSGLGGLMAAPQSLFRIAAASSD